MVARSDLLQLELDVAGAMRPLSVMILRPGPLRDFEGALRMKPKYGLISAGLSRPTPQGCIHLPIVSHSVIKLLPVSAEYWRLQGIYRLPLPVPARRDRETA
jgi:hypothetical protein